MGEYRSSVFVPMLVDFLHMGHINILEVFNNTRSSHPVTL
jgi:glycerol-3-phosphate cytidylyltransferase-like family protein